MVSQFPIHSAKMASRLLIGLLLSAPLFAAIDVRIDLQHIENNLGSAANWNTLLNNTSLTNLIDFNTGSGTGIDIFNSGISNSSSSTAHWDADKDWVADLAGDDSIGTNSGTGLIFFAGLSAPFYQVEIVSASISFSRLAILRVEGAIARPHVRREHRCGSLGRLQQWAGPSGLADLGRCFAARWGAPGYPEHRQQQHRTDQRHQDPGDSGAIDLCGNPWDIHLNRGPGVPN